MFWVGEQAELCKQKWDKYITPLSDTANAAMGVLVEMPELETALSKLKKHTVPGPTGKMPEMLVWLDVDNWIPLLAAVNEVLTTGNAPEAWK